MSAEGGSGRGRIKLPETMVSADLSVCRNFFDPQISAPSEAWRFLPGANPGRVRASPPPVARVAPRTESTVLVWILEHTRSVGDRSNRIFLLSFLAANRLRSGLAVGCSALLGRGQALDLILPRDFSATHKSYCDCWFSQLSADVPNALDSRIAISGLIPARSFKIVVFPFLIAMP